MKKKGKYLFFDIECCNGYNICSFGYAIVSEELKVLLKKDLLINPENRFVLSPKGKRPKMELAYPEEMFYKQDAFPSFYKEIKRLMCEEGYILIGHSIQSDFHFLKYACERYNLPLFNMEGFDTQKMYQRQYNTPHVESLEKIIENLELDPSRLTFHRSCDDALATFYVARAICQKENLSLDELLSLHKDCIVQSKHIFNKQNENQEKKSKKVSTFSKNS